MDERLAAFVDPRQAAVVVIDVQNTFCHPQGRFARAGNDVSVYQRLAERLAPFVVEARKAGVRVIWVRGERNPWLTDPAGDLVGGRSLAPYGRENQGEGLAQAVVATDDAWEQDFYLLKPAEGELILQKDRYSAFQATDLDLVLRSQGIRTLILTGLAGNVCVESTARDGFMMGYRIIMTSDGTASRDPTQHKGTLVNIDKFYGTVVSLADLVKAWERSRIRSPLVASEGRGLAARTE